MSMIDLCFILGPNTPDDFDPGEMQTSRRPRKFASDKEFDDWFVGLLNRRADYEKIQVVISETHKKIAKYIRFDSSVAIVNHAVWGAEIAYYNDHTLLDRMRDYVRTYRTAFEYINETIFKDVIENHVAVCTKRNRNADSIITAQKYSHLLTFGKDLLEEKTITFIKNFISTVNNNIQLDRETITALRSYFDTHPHTPDRMLDICRRAMTEKTENI